MVFQMYICFIIRFLLVDYGKVFSTNELPQNSNASSREENILWVLTASK